jgi:hypothetical protein
MVQPCVYREFHPSILIDYVTEAPNFNGDDHVLCLFLTLFASPFKSKSRLEAEKHFALTVTAFATRRRMR